MLNHEPLSKELMREMNRSLVLNIIRLNGPISRAQIARESGLSPATVSGITSELIDEELVFIQQEGNSSGGRRPMLLSLNPSGGFVVGIKLMENQLIAALTNLEAKIVGSETVTFTDSSSEKVIQKIVLCISHLLKKHQIPESKLYGIGVGLAGVVEQNTGILRHSPIFGWQGLPIGKMIQKQLQVPVFIDNDVNTVTLTEKWFGIARDIDHFLTVTVGRGVGMGIVVNGRLYRGKGGAGEIGHVVVDPNGLNCSCGKRGCLETYVSDPALVRQAKLDPKISNLIESIDDLRILAEEGNTAAQNIYQVAGEKLGQELANLIDIFNPELIILTGEGVKARHLFSDNMFEAVRSHTMPGLGMDTKIHLDELEDLAWAKGAAGLVLRGVFESPIFKEDPYQLI